jgi:hypothetical protein
VALAGRVLEAEGMERIWHPSIVRFGANTLKTFRQRPAPDTVLGADDMFFVDLGPVFDGHEGDVGDTFVTGANPDMQACAAAARRRRPVRVAARSQKSCVTSRMT